MPKLNRDWNLADELHPSIPHSIRQHRRRVRNTWIALAIAIVTVSGAMGYWGAPAVGMAVVALVAPRG